MRFLFNQTYAEKYDDIPLCIQKQLIERIGKKFPNQHAIELINDDVNDMLERSLKLYVKRKEKAKIYAATKRSASKTTTIHKPPIEVVGEPMKEHVNEIPPPPILMRQPPPAPPPPSEEEESEDESEEEESEEEAPNANKSQIIVPDSLTFETEQQHIKNKPVIIQPQFSLIDFRGGLLTFV